MFRNLARFSRSCSFPFQKKPFARRSFSSSHFLKKEVLYAFGSSTNGQLGVPVKTDGLYVPEKVLEAEEIKDISCKAGIAFTVLDGNRVFCWGNNKEGYLGIRTRVILKKPTLIESLKDLKIDKVACGRKHAIFLSENNEVYAIGNNEFGQLGLGDCEHRYKPAKIEALDGQKVIQISSGLDHNVALTEDGKVFTWGWNAEGQSGQGQANELLIPTQLKDVEHMKFIYVACGIDNTALVSEDGELWVFGHNQVAQLGLGDKTNRNGPCLVEALCDKQISSVALGGGRSLMLTTDNDLYITGLNEDFLLGIFDQSDSVPFPRPITFFKNKEIAQISSGGSTCFVLTENNEMYSWGFGLGGRLGNGRDGNESEPTLVEFFEDKKVNYIYCALDHTFVVVEE